MVGLTQNASETRLDVKAADDKETQIRARYVIACDGASSALRGLAGIALEDLGFDQP